MPENKAISGPQPNPFEKVKRDLDGSKFYSLPELKDARVNKLPICIRILLESALRNCDEFQVTSKDVETILDWERKAKEQVEIQFKPARVILQDFTGVPAVADLAAMREAIVKLGGDAQKINPLIPTDLVIDHSVVVDAAGQENAREINEQKEFERNRERFAFLKWGQTAFDNMLVVPPGSGIVHQVNLEYLARVVFMKDGLLYPDSVVGTDSHTTMIDGLGIVGWGVGGIEAEAVMLGQPICMVLPEVVGVKLDGKLRDHVTATDLVLILTKMLRARNVVGKFVEFYGPGVADLSIADRATIANMSPEYGATMGFFPFDHCSEEYLIQCGKEANHVEKIANYFKAQEMYKKYDAVGNCASDSEIVFTGEIITLDLTTVEPAVAGPKRPHDHVPLSIMKEDFLSSLPAPVGFKGYGIPQSKLNATAAYTDKAGNKHTLRHGSVVIAAITSCTNTSNPAVMLGAGLLAKRAVEKGLTVPGYVKASLSPGSHVVERYLADADLLKPLSQLGFALAGFGCMTCIGNSGDLEESLGNVITQNELVAGAVLSGNRNFEGRIHPLTRANYLASPILVVAYALAGRCDIDFNSEPLGTDKLGKPVMLNDIFPSKTEIKCLEKQVVTPNLFLEEYGKISKGNARWDSLDVTKSEMYAWEPTSTYVTRPPFFDKLEMVPAPVEPVDKAYCFLHLGDSITTDHISPAGKIATSSPAGLYLKENKVVPADFNSYGSRRGNDYVMVRGTFANIRLVNKLVDQVGPMTLHVPSGEIKPIYDVAQMYKKENMPVIVIAGKEYGSGSSRDWAAKGQLLQGVRCVIAQSYERIHRSNLVGMGVLPLEFKPEQCAESLGLKPKEHRFTILLNENTLQVRNTITVEVSDLAGNHIKSFEVICRIDTPVEIQYFNNGGILPYVLRQIATTA